MGKEFEALGICRLGFAGMGMEGSRKSDSGVTCEIS